MEIVGYLAYATLIILAIVWTIDVRRDIGADKPALLRAVYFVMTASLVPAFNVNLGHCLWLAPFGCFLARLIAPTLVKIPFVSVPFIVIADIFEWLVHIGIPRHKIHEAQSNSIHSGDIDSCSLKEVGDKSG